MKKAASVFLILALVIGMVSGCADTSKKSAAKEQAVSGAESSAAVVLDAEKVSEESIESIIDPAESSEEAADTKETKVEEVTKSDKFDVKQNADTKNGSGQVEKNGTQNPVKTGSQTSKVQGVSQTVQNVSASSSNEKKTDTDSKPQAGTTPSKPETVQPKPEEHVHQWVTTTEIIHHDAEGHYEERVVQEAWDEPIYESQPVYTTYSMYRCGKCGAETEPTIKGFLAHSEAAHPDGGSSYSTVQHEVPTGEMHDVQIGTNHHNAVTEQVWVETKAASDETVTHTRCSCGAEK